MIELLVETTARSGAWNMAVDEYLLESALETGQCAVRVYSWETPTVSLGYFQNADEFRSSNRFQSLPAVRRLSGGGAILHDRELTYSLALAASHPLTTDPTRLYEIVHAAIIRQLDRIGVPAAMRGTDQPQSDEPFLCFIRGDRHDILCDGHKIVGSAQRRRRGAVLQHGSVILQSSPQATEVPGILDLVKNVQLPPDFAERVGREIAANLGSVSPCDDWSEDRLGRIRLLEDRYQRIDWKRASAGEAESDDVR